MKKHFPIVIAFLSSFTAIQAHAAGGWDNSCGTFSSGSAMPQGCMIPPLASAAATRTQAFSIDDIRTASNAKPVFKNFASGVQPFEYDLKLDNICDSPTSMSTVTNEWVGERPPAWAFITQEKSVAMIAVVTFPDERELKQIKLPIIAKANFGDPNVQNCEGTIVKRVQANASLRLHFEFKSKQVTKFPDQSKFIGGIGKVAASGLALASYAGAGPALGAVITPIVSFVEKNASPIKLLNEGANDIMESFADERKPDPKQYEVAFNAQQAIYRGNNKPIFTVTKIPRDSGIVINPAGGWPPVAGDFTRAYGSLTDLFFNASSTVESPWSANLPKFCDKLRAYIDRATKGDKVATSLGIGYHAYYFSPEYQPGKTCLNKQDIAKLIQLKYAAPFPGAWQTETAEAPVSPHHARTDRHDSRSTRAAYARMNR